MARGSCIGGRLTPTALSARSGACAVKLPPLPGFARSLWSNNDGEYVLEAREYTRHALALRASAPQKSPRATACASAGLPLSSCAWQAAKTVCMRSEIARSWGKSGRRKEACRSFIPAARIHPQEGAAFDGQIRRLKREQSRHKSLLACTASSNRRPEFRGQALVLPSNPISPIHG
jgi:hypothetical protein